MTTGPVVPESENTESAGASTPEAVERAKDRATWIRALESKQFCESHPEADYEEPWHHITRRRETGIFEAVRKLRDRTMVLEAVLVRLADPCTRYSEMGIPSELVRRAQMAQVALEGKEDPPDWPSPSAFTAAIFVGNTDNKLTQQQWCIFVSRVRHRCRSFGEVKFDGGTPSDAPRQSHGWAVQLERSRLEDMELFRSLLAQEAQEFSQDSIAIMAAPVSMVGRPHDAER